MNKKQKKILYRISLTVVVFVVALIVPAEVKWNIVPFLIAYLIVGYDVLWKALTNVFRAQFLDEQFLMVIASIGAFLIDKSSEAVAVMLFFQIGELFQSLAVGRSRKSISKLMDIKPDYATLLKDGEEVTVSPEEVEVGDIILVKPGEKIPLDGVIYEGSTTINSSALTGESIPQDKNVNDSVLSGSVNITTLVKVKVNSIYEESTVCKILNLVENSYMKKAKTENFITRFAKYYTPCVVVCALILGLIPPLFFQGQWSSWINRALIFLVVSCPCAVVISVPLSFFGGIGGASKSGILIKGANHLEALSKVNTVVFDKTGTLTEGSFKVNKIYSESLNKEELLNLVALAESYSNHPIAESIQQAYGKEINKSRIKSTTEISGCGIEAKIDDEVIFVGNEKLMDMNNISYSKCDSIGTVLYVSTKNKYLGYIVIADEIKPQAKEAINELKNSGIEKNIMLTGDLKKVAHYVANQLGLDDFYSELLPQDKVKAIEEIISKKQKNTNVAFVGDGINDAPVLSRVDVGIAMGGLGSDAAIEAADVVLMDDNPKNIDKAIAISKKTMRIVRENIIFTLSIKFIVLILGALGIANMWLAVFADVGLMVIAILNSIRTLRR